MNITYKNVALGEVLSSLNITEGAEHIVLSPDFQRQYILSDRQRDTIVTNTLEGIPLGDLFIFHDGKHYELMDGRQRLETLLGFYDGDFQVKIEGSPTGFKNLTAKERSDFLETDLRVAVVEGEDRERKNWFELLNLQGSNLSSMEKKISRYNGPFLSQLSEIFILDNEEYFDRVEMYLSGKKIRGKRLETLLKWKAQSEGLKIDEYLAFHQNDQDISPVLTYFEEVTHWAGTLFPTYRQEMCEVPWGELYNTYHGYYFSPEILEIEVEKLMRDEEVSKKSGIYPYLITEDPRYLSLRDFAPETKRTVYEKQDGKCNICGNHFDYRDTQADHIIPWSKGGKTVIENCQILCRRCNLEKSNHDFGKF